MRFVFTGMARLNGARIDRKLLVELAKERGHEVQPKVIASTSRLVTDRPEKKTAKRKAAEWWGVPVISTAEFLSLMEGS